MTPTTPTSSPARRERTTRRRILGPTPRVARRRVAALVAVAFLGGGVIAISGGDDHGRALVERYAKAWDRGDWATMYAALDVSSRKRLDVLRFARRHRKALATATATAIATRRPRRKGAGWTVPATVRTRAFGSIAAVTRLTLTKGNDGYRIVWQPRLVFPGLRAGERLSRRTAMPARGALLARDGTVLASGRNRTSSVADIAAQVVGGLETIPPERALELEALGVPPDAQVGASGLERIFEEQLGGVPSGKLRAGSRVIGSSSGRRGRDVRTTISTTIERAAIAALAGRNGGVVAFDPRDGAVLAFAGVPFSQLQPPGSTFKIVTAAGALENKITSPTERFPFATEAVLSGVRLANHGGENCGGSLAQAFAVSCNSVFAPLGARLGAQRLVRTAKAFGFNQDSPIAGAATSLIPPADQIGDDLAVGSSAIGQGRVQASALQMAVVAGTIADRGRRPKLTLDLRETARRRGRLSAARGERAVSTRTAARVERMMVGVVRGGTGTGAAIAGIDVAGKTGTAELKNREPGDTTTNPEDTDAWFVAYAPARKRHPKIVVGVLLIQAGTGGDVAAPAARGVLLAGVQRK